MKFCGKWALNDEYTKKCPWIGLAVGYLTKAPLFSFFVVKLTGCIASADKNAMKQFMKKQIPFGLLPGGFNEATIHRYGKNIIYIKNRKGFIKYCIQNGYEIMPGYVFGECYTYHNLSNLLSHKITQFLNKYKIPTVFPYGPYWKYLFPLLPYKNIGLHLILGKSIICQKIDNPTKKILIIIIIGI